MGLKAAGFHRQAVSAQQIRHGLIKAFGLFGACGGGKRRAAAVAGIGVECELRNQQHRAAGVLQRAVQFAVAVFKNPQCGDFVGDVAGICFGVLRADAQQHREAV